MFFRTSQNYDFPAGTILGSAKDPHRFQVQSSSLWLVGIEQQTWFALGASEADIALSSLQAPAADQKVPAPFGLWADHAHLSWEFKRLQERSTRAELLLSKVHCLWSAMCMQQAAILQQQQKQQRQKLPEAPRRREGSPMSPPKFANLFNFLRGLANA